MNWRLSVLFVFILSVSSGFGQFGSLTKVFDKARSLAELDISEEEERALGEAISERIRAIYGVEQDPEVTRYVTLVGKVVAEKSDRPDLDYRFIVLDSDSTNAFAAPGGFIHITRGALAIMESEADLAGVLAHELAHVVERHTIKGIQKMKGIELADDQTSLTGNSQVFQMVADKATEALLQGFGRTEELEADEIGADLSAESNYSPAGLVNFLQSLQSRYEDRETKAGLFASHPQIEERIEKLEAHITKRKLASDDKVLLGPRFGQNVQYELSAFVGTGEGVEGAMGMAQTEGSEKKADQDEAEGEEEKEGGGFLSKLKNPFGSGDKEERAEVTGSAAARGVETELGIEEPGDPTLVTVEVTQEEVEEFKAQGGLA